MLTHDPIDFCPAAAAAAEIIRLEGVVDHVARLITEAEAAREPVLIAQLATLSDDLLLAADEARAVVKTLAAAFDTVNIKAGLAFQAVVARPRGRGGPAQLIGLSMQTGPASTLTLTLDVSRRFSAMTMAMLWLAARISSLCSGVKPVVPIIS